MSCDKRTLFILLFVTVQSFGENEYVVPDVTLEAFRPKGFKASIPATAETQLFGFHGNVNKRISLVEPGDYNMDITSAKDNYWTYFNPDLALQLNDTVNYWYFVQNSNLGYRKGGLSWRVTELIDLKETACVPTKSMVHGKTKLCANSLILEENFNGNSINTNEWTIEHYIPSDGPDFEFVSYQNDESVCYINSNKLFIKPKAVETEQLMGTLDLTQGCTRPNQNEICTRTGSGVFILPPVVSGKIVSKLKFKYGKIEVRAKLPAGDWIYPQIYLEQDTKPNKKLWIAYSRGNEDLVSKINATNDIGGRWLFGGPVLSPLEPSRSLHLASDKSSVPYSSKTHIFTATWKPESILLEVDGNPFGEINDDTLKDIKLAENDMMKLVLGVGVGGVNDFPDGFRSGKFEKPWKNYSRDQVKKFFAGRNEWLPTWKGDNAALQIESVKIWTL